MLVPRSHQEDATIVLNNLLKEYDKNLRPDIGGKAGGGGGLQTGANSRCFHVTEGLVEEPFIRVGS